MYAMIDYVGAVQEFPPELLRSWASKVKLHSSNFVFQDLRRSHLCNTSRERTTNIRGDYKNWNNEHYSQQSEVIMRSSCKIKCNLQLDEWVVSEATKFEGSTLYVIHSTRCRPGLTHVGNIPLQLLQCTSGQMVGPPSQMGHDGV